MEPAQESSRGERTRQAILDAAERLILSQGYHGTSMRQIAREAGVAVGGIYNHFEGKEAIFTALMERRQPYSGIAAAILGLARENAGDDVRELVEKAVRTFVELVSQDPVFVRLAFIDMQEFGGDTIFHFARQMIQGLFLFFNPLVASGEIREDLPLPVLLRTFAGMVISFVLMDMVGFGGGAPRVELPFAADSADIDWIGGMVGIFLNGVAREA